MAMRRQENHEAPRFSRRWWLNCLRSLLWVSVISVLIWLYADMEVAGTERIALTIRLTAGKSQDLMLLSPREEKVAFTIRGSRAAVKDFATKYNSTELTYDVSGCGYGMGQAIPMSDVLNKVPDILSLGLEVVSVSPPAIARVDIDRRIHQSVPVEFEYKAVLKEPPMPTLMGITVAESRWEEIRKRQPPETRPALKTVEQTFEKAQAGQDQQVAVEWRLIPQINGIEVMPDQPSITTTVVVQQLTGVKTVSVPVRVQAPAIWLEDGTWKKYVLRRKAPEDWQKDLKVAGPVKDLDQLNASNISAYVVLTDDDKKFVESWLPGEIVVRFPEDLKVRLAEKPSGVQFKLELLQPTNP